jgi:Ca2+-transporting ATPase
VEGLTTEQAKERLETYGKNEVVRQKRFLGLRMFLRQFSDPLVLLLIAAAVLSFFTGEPVDAALILSIVFLNGLFGFFQEFKAEKTIEGIRDRLVSEVKVKRDGKIETVPSSMLVPGDLIILEPGERVPADGEIALGSLKIDESALTGESIPADKSVNEKVFAGTLVVKGRAEVNVTATGMNSRIGEISALAEGSLPTPFQKKLRALSSVLGKAVVLISLAVAVFGIISGRGLLRMVEFGISLGVAAVPEGLIILSTMCLAIGVKRMADHKAIVKRFPSVEGLGSVDVLCVDKTGTITENRLTVKDSWGDYDAMKIAASLTSQELKDPLDQALREWAGHGHPESFEPFDSDKKYAKAVLKGRIYVKGNPEVVLKFCRGVKKEAYAMLDEIADKGLKVLAFASGADEEHFEFHGFVGLYDPPRKGVEKIIQSALESGISIKMITGDHPKTAEAIARQVGITGDVVDVSSGGFDEANLANVGVFARVTPEDKLKIVNALKNRGFLVAMTGDGVNDAPAIKKADVGIALGSGTDIAKDSADIVLLDDNLSTIVRAVNEGRNVFANVKTATRYLLSMNVAEILAIVTGIFFGQILFTPVQILWMNLVTDSLPALAFAYDMNPVSDKNKSLLDRKTWAKIISTGFVVGASTLVSFLVFGPAAALNAMIFSEILYQPIIRRKSRSTGGAMAYLLLALTVVLQIFSALFLGPALGVSLPGKELIVVLASLPLLLAV